MSADLTPLESAVLNKLLDKPGEPFATLREQLAHIEVASRELTGVGFFTNFTLAANAPVRRDVPSTEVTGVGATIPQLEHEAGFILFVRDGIASMLEGYTYGDSAWPDSVTEFTVFAT